MIILTKDIFLHQIRGELYNLTCFWTIQPPHPYTGYFQCSTFRTISSLILQFYELLLYDEIRKQKAGHRERKNMSDIIPNFLQLCMICTRFYDIYQLSSLHHFIWLVFLVWHCNMSFICRFLQAKVKFYKCSQNFMFLPKLIFFYTRPPCQILDHKMFSFLSDADTGTSISRQVCGRNC